MWKAAGVAICLLLMMQGVANAHTETELDEWMVEWVKRADSALLSGLLDEYRDMQERHPWYWAPRVVARDHPTRSTWSGNVEQWRPLVARYFSPGDVDTAMRVLNCETGGTGNPNSYNERSGASGLFQQLPKYWASRSAKAGWAGASIMDPEANVAVSAWLRYFGGGWGHWTCY